jgi:hypothetical protein
MEESIGRASQPTTDADEPDARRLNPDIQRRVRDIPPPIGYEDAAFTDPDAENRPVDPLDPQRPSRTTGDPLDPNGHVI